MNRSPKTKRLQNTEGAVVVQSPALPAQTPPPNAEGRGIYRRQLEQFSTLDDKQKHALLRETWKEVAMGAALRAKALIATCSPKDFSSMYKVVMSGAVAIDKAYPQEGKRELAGPSLVVNMFGSLGQRAARIAIPETPATIDVTPQEVPWPDSATTKTPLLKTNTEMSPTTKLSQTQLPQPL